MKALSSAMLEFFNAIGLSGDRVKVVALGENNVVDKTYQTDAWFRPKVVKDISLLHGMFTFNVPKAKWYETSDGVEQTDFTLATSENGSLVMRSGGLNEKRGLRSFRHPRYEPNRGIIYSGSFIFPTPEALGERTIGTFTVESGVGFRLRQGVWYAVRRTKYNGIVSDVEVQIDMPADIDFESGNVFDIQYQWRGVGNYFFYVNLKPVLVLELLGTLPQLSMWNPALPIAFECIDQGEPVEIICGCVDVSSEGGKDNGKTYGSVGVETDSGSVALNGFNTPVLAIRSKRLVGSDINTRDTLALLATAYGDQKAVVRVWSTRDDTAVIENDQTWQDYGDGHLEYMVRDTTVATEMALDITKANLDFTCRVSQDASYSTSALFEGRTEIYMTPGDTLIFTLHKESVGNMTGGVTFEFAEAI